MRFGKHALALLFSFSIFGGSIGDALAERALTPAPNQVNAPSWNKAEKASAQQHGQWGANGYPFAESRLEAELQGSFADEKAWSDAIDIMDGIAVKTEDHQAVSGGAKASADYRARQARAAKTFGKGNELVRIKETGVKGAWEVADLYVDDDEGTLERTGAAIRIRKANGVAMLNFKPPTRLRFDNGVAHGVENGFDVAGISITEKGDKIEVEISDKALGFLTSKSTLNPLREISQIYPGKFPRTGKGGKMTASDRAQWKETLKKLFTPRVAIKQDRVKYQILEHGVTMNEITLDRVVAKNAQNLKAKEFVDYRAEAEGDHVTLQMLTGLQANPKARASKAIMHPAAITWHPSITRVTQSGKLTTEGVGAPEIPQIHHVAETLQRILPRLTPAGISKYVGAARALGITPTGLPPVHIGNRAAPQKPVDWKGVPRIQDKVKPTRSPAQRATAPRGKGAR